MAKLLKKINRGVALGVVLLIGLIIFFIMDSTAFEKEIPDLKDFLDEYLAECAKINLLPEQYRQSGATVPDEVIDAKIKEGKEFVEKYFTDYKLNEGNYTSTKETLLLSMDSFYKENRDKGYTIEDFKYSLISIHSMQKQSANAVKIRFTANLTISSHPDAQYVNLVNVAQSLRPGETESGKEVTDNSSEITYTIILFKVDGEWKIAGFEGYYFNNTRAIVVSK